ncbi:mechanosensitive ion channel family protein [Pseudooceanicola sp.]|uniref:mechanosensitive ion channel family protein n=1 Tax=Pseudooceanicola sp. TaxID=1914328 RepID=UPI0035C780D2
MGVWCAALLVALLTLAPHGLAQEPEQTWYETDTLNAGLGAPPDQLDRETPRAIVRGFLDFAEQSRFEEAAHFLNLEDIPQGEQAARGPDLAQKLFEVIDRRVWINLSSLPSRPDARITSNAANSGEHPERFRRNVELAKVEAEGRIFEIRIARFKPADAEEAVWLFSPQTVDNIGLMHEAFGPRAFERYIPDVLKREYGALRLWEWVGLPLLLAALATVGWSAQWLVNTLARQFSRPLLQWAITRASAPVALFAVAGTAQLILGHAVSFSGPVTSVVQPLLVILMVAGVGIAGLRIVDAILDRITRRYIGDIDDARSVDQRELYTSIYALRRIVLLLMVGFALLYVLSQIQVFESIGVTLLASAGVLTVLLGIAGQSVLGNILASLQIALAKPVRIGDSVLFEGDWAYVESIYYTFLRLRTWDERRIIVPVQYFVSKPFENWSVKDARMMKTVSLRLDHTADPAELREAFERLAREDEDVIDHDTLACFVTGHDDHGQEITFYAMTPDPSKGWVVEMRLREGLMRYVRETHPEWWPRDRIANGEGLLAGGAGDAE